NEDLEIVLDTKGEKIPEEMYLVLPSGPVKMENRKNGRFAFTLRNLQQNIPLSFQTGIFNSDPYHIKVIPRPVVSYFSIQIKYPAYLNKASEKFENTGDLSIPTGSEI